MAQQIKKTTLPPPTPAAAEGRLSALNKQLEEIKLRSWSIPSFAADEEILYASYSFSNDKPLPKKRSTVTQHPAERVSYVTNRLKLGITLFEVTDVVGSYRKVAIDLQVCPSQPSSATNDVISLKRDSTPSSKIMALQFEYLLRNPPPADIENAKVTNRYRFNFTKLNNHQVRALLAIAKQGDGTLIDYGWIEVFQNINFAQNMPARTGKVKSKFLPPKANRRNPWASATSGNSAPSSFSFAPSNPSYCYVESVEQAEELLDVHGICETIPGPGGIKIVVEKVSHVTMRYKGKPIIINNEF
jgi:hypothetical protein